MPTFEVVEFALVVDRANFVRVEVCIVLSVCNGGVLTPRSFPQFVKHSEILISLQITLVMLYRRIDADGFERCFLPTGDDVPSVEGRRLATHLRPKMTPELWH